MEVMINGNRRQLEGNPPANGDQLPHFKVFNAYSDKVKMRELLGKPLLISVVPDINTPVCSLQTRKFNADMDQYPGVRFATISVNPPADQQHWCAAEGVKNMEMLSDFEQSFGYAMGLLIPDEGFLARAIYVVDASGKIQYHEIVDDLEHEPDYEKALSAVKKLL